MKRENFSRKNLCALGVKLLKKYREESKQVVGDVNNTVDKNKCTVLVEKSEEESNDLETEKLLISL